MLGRIGAGAAYAFVAVLLLCQPTPGAPPCIDYSQHLRVVESLAAPGNQQALVVSGGYAFAASATGGVQVLDVSDLPALELVAIYSGIYAWDIAIENGLACVATESDGFVTLDVSNPALPEFLGSLPLPNRARGVVIDGEYAYITTFGRLHVIDVTEPRVPVEVATVAFANGGGSLVVAEGTAYVTGSGLTIVDVSDPTSPLFVTTLAAGQTTLGIWVWKETVYLTRSGLGIFVVDVSQRDSPAIVDTLETSGNAVAVAPHGPDHLLFADGWGGLHVVDIASNGEPKLLGTVTPPRYAACVRSFGKFAVVGSGFVGGFHVVDLTLPPARGLRVVDLPGRPVRVTTQGDYAYLADHFGGLQIVSLQDPSRSGLIGSLDGPGTHAVAVLGDYCYAATMMDGLRIIDVSDPENPQLAGSYTLSRRVLGVSVHGDLACITDGSGYLRLLDVETPAAPVWRGQLRMSGEGRDVTMDATTALVAWGAGYPYDGSLQVVDVSDAARPVVVGVVDTPGTAIGVTRVGDLAFVADGGRGVQIIDPGLGGDGNMGILASVPIPGRAERVIVEGPYAYVASASGAVFVVDVSDVTAPAILGSYEVAGVFGYDVAMSDKALLFACGDDGLHLLSAQCEAVPVHAPAERAGRDGPAVLTSRPNPFGTGTTVGVALDGPTIVHLGVYSAAGRLVRTLRDGPLSGGSRAFSWDGRDGEGRAVASGVYYLRLRTERGTVTRAVVRLR